jgi:hypothetical protein
MKSVRYKATIILLLCIFTISGCQWPDFSPPEDYGFYFEEVTEELGIDFVHEKPVFDDVLENVMPWMASTGAGVAVADYNNNGFMDLYFVNSHLGDQNAFFRNNGDGTFENVAEEAGVADVNHEGISTTALWFDFNNNGYQDLYIGAWGKSKLYLNNGDSTFTDITDEAGVGFEGYVAKVITLDYDRDGYLDLYLACYFREEHDLWNLDTTKIMFDDFERARNGGRNVLFRNNGDGTFTDVSVEMGVDDPGWTLATGAADINNDGWPDIFNANDFGPDGLLINQEGKGFEKVIQRRGIADDTFKGMNVDFADVFHDGNLAMYISNISKPRYLLEGNQMWHQDASGEYIDRAEEMGVHQAGFSWGARFFDVNNSGHQSLMVTNGFISAKENRSYWFDMGILATTPGYIIEDTQHWASFEDKSMSGYEEKLLFLNDGTSFRNVAQDVGITFVDDGRGIAVVDLFNTGVLDLVFANQGGPARVYQNHHTNGNNWIKLDLVGSPPSNRDAVGARVTFEVNGVHTMIERDGGNSHGGQSDPRIHLGLGEAEKADKITIRWPSGRVEEFTNVGANQILHIVENDYYSNSR